MKLDIYTLGRSYGIRDRIRDGLAAEVSGRQLGAEFGCDFDNLADSQSFARKRAAIENALPPATPFDVLVS